MHKINQSIVLRVFKILRTGKYFSVTKFQKLYICDFEEVGHSQMLMTSSLSQTLLCVEQE